MKERYPFFTVIGGAVNCEDDVKIFLRQWLKILEMDPTVILGMLPLYVNRTTNPITLLHVSDDLKNHYTHMI